MPTQPPVQQPPVKSRSKLPLIIGVVVVLALLGTGVTIAAGHGDPKPKVADTNSFTAPTTSKTMTNQDTTPASTTPAAPAKSAKVVNAVISDPDLGYSVTATNVVVNPFPFPDKYKSFGEGKVIVLVQYTAKASTKYSGSPAGSAISLVGATGTATSPSTSNYTAEMQAGSYTPGPFSVSTGQSVTGYEAYAVANDQVATLSLQYKRPAVKILNGGQSLPAQIFTAKLF